MCNNKKTIKEIEASKIVDKNLVIIEAMKKLNDQLELSNIKNDSTSENRNIK